MKSTPSARFARTAATYHDRGWDPVPCHGKELLVRGYTGRNGARVTVGDVRRWSRTYRNSNVAVRLPEFMVGLDIDNYDGRDGYGTYRALCDELGEPGITDLSNTLDPVIGYSVPFMTSRPKESKSGIMLFRIPEGTELRGSAGQGIDIIQWFHRYVMAWPSIHPDTRSEYVLCCAMTRDGEYEIGGYLDDIFTITSSNPPMLSEAWIEYLSRPPAETGNVVAPSVAREWWREVSGGNQCTIMEEATIRALDRLQEAYLGGGLHDEMCRAVWELVHYAAEGHRGLGKAIREIREAFLSSGRLRPLQAEWQRAIIKAVCHAAACSQEEGDPCDEDYTFTPRQSQDA